MISPLALPGQHATVTTYTLSQPEDVAYWHGAIAHVVAQNIPGAIVECGVWKGGMLKAAQLSLATLDATREIWGYDTFAGMTETGPNDTGGGDQVGKLAVPLEDVRGLCGDGVRLVVGDVRQLDTLPKPKKIAVLRLDVDWHDNTLACLSQLWPRLSLGGVLLIDDYNFWDGCKRAVDGYLGPTATQLVRTGTGSGLVKVSK